MMMPLGWYVAVALQVRPDFKNPKSEEASAWFYTSVEEVSKAAGWVKCARRAEGCQGVGGKLGCRHIVCYICMCTCTLLVYVVNVLPLCHLPCCRSWIACGPCSSFTRSSR